MRKALKKIVIVFIIELMIINFFAQSFCKVEAKTGQSAKQAGETIAAWAIDFYEKHESQCVYQLEGRENTYIMGVSDNDKTSTYYFDCVGFVSFAVHHAIGLNSDWTIYGTPSQYGLPDNQAFQKVETKSKTMAGAVSELLPGDIVVCYGHVFLYLGNGMSLGMNRGGLHYRLAIEEEMYQRGNPPYSGYVMRITEEAAKRADFTYIKGAGVGTGDQVSICTADNGHPDPGDTDGQEYRMQGWYDGGWKAVYRYSKEPKIQKEIASEALSAAENNNIGYSVSNRTTFAKQLEKVNYDITKISTKCDADSASSVAAILRAVGNKSGIDSFKNVKLFTESEADEELLKLGFEKLTDKKYLNGFEELSEGDILVNPGSNSRVGKMCIFVGGSYQAPSLPVDEVTVDLDKQEFNFAGNPQKMTYAGERDLGEWIFSKFSQFISFLLGILLNGIKYSVLGWTFGIEKIANNALYSIENYTSGVDNYQVSAEDDEKKIYTIEDIIYNKIPLLDVNFFSNKAGGKEIKEGSFQEKIRTMTASWYVSFRNLTIVGLAIMLIYYGIRMLIATTATKKADFKQMLINWFKSMVLIVVLNVIIYLVLYLNNWLVEFLRNSTQSSEGLYELIRTRAADFRLSIGIPATIMYIVLVVAFFRFLYSYLIRLFRITVYIALAPLVVLKYAYEGAKGKTSQIFGKWLTKYVTQVFIQSIHALLYTVFISTALQSASENLMSFILSMVLISFMLDADDIIVNMFKFENSELKDHKKRFSVKDTFASAFLAYSVTKTVGKGVINAGKYVGSEVNMTLKEKYKEKHPEFNQHPNLSGEDEYKGVIGKITQAEHFIEEKLERATMDKVDANGNVIKERGKLAKEANNVLKLRRLSRYKGAEGVYARKALKKKNKFYKKTFKSQYKFVKGMIAGGAYTILVIPSAVVYDDKLGLTTAMKGINNYLDVYEVTSYGHRKKVKKENKKINETIEKLSDVDNNLDFIEKNLNEMDDAERNEKLNGLKEYQKQNINSFLLKKKIEDFVDNNGIDQINPRHLNFIISNILMGLDLQLTDDQKREVLRIARDRVEQNKLDELNKNRTQANRYTSLNANQTFEEKDVAKGINDAIIEVTFGEDKKEIAEALDKVNSANEKELRKKDNIGKFVDTNRFLNNL